MKNYIEQVNKLFEVKIECDDRFIANNLVIEVDPEAKCDG